MKILFKTVLSATFLLLIGLMVSAKPAQDSFFDKVDLFLKESVDNQGNVAYKNLSSDPSSLNELTDMIANYDLSDKSAAEKKAFYTNTYNILVIKQIVDRFPIKGPLTVNGFFDKIKNNVAGEELTLNQVEKDKNLYVTKDERLHFAVVCGAKGCPPLANFAYTPENIEEQLDARTKVALNSDYFIRVKKGKVAISQIFQWYRDDFFKDKNMGGLVGYLNKYRKNQIPAKSKIVYYEYDWNLNSQSDSK